MVRFLERYLISVWDYFCIRNRSFTWIFIQLFIYTTSAITDTWWILGLQSRGLFLGSHNNTFTHPVTHSPSPGNISRSWSGEDQHTLEVALNPTLCLNLDGLTPGQVKFCQLYPDHMEALSRGARMGIEECQHQFRWRRWNCSTVTDGSVFGPSLDKGSREAAYVHAMLAAGVVHSISRACRDGEIGSCGCSKRARPRNLPRDWLWGGCGDNTDYGYRFAQGFVDIREKEKNYPRHSKQLARMLMNIHNNEAGRRAVLRHAKLSCKCHGVSGSCSVRTCWHQLPSFRYIGDYLTLKYDQSGTTIDHQVTFNKPGTSLIRQPQMIDKPKGGAKRSAMQQDSAYSERNERPMKLRERRKTTVSYQGSFTTPIALPRGNKNNKRNKDISSEPSQNFRNKNFELDPSQTFRNNPITRTIRPAKDQLVYLESSPNYCLEDVSLGTMGTLGRGCKREGEGPDSCHVICCGRGYNTESVRKVERCRCRFEWCCAVHCDTCETRTDIDTCK